MGKYQTFHTILQYAHKMKQFKKSSIWGPRQRFRKHVKWVQEPKFQTFGKKSRESKIPKKSAQWVRDQTFKNILHDEAKIGRSMKPVKLSPESKILKILGNVRIKVFKTCIMSPESMFCKNSCKMVLGLLTSARRADWERFKKGWNHAKWLYESEPSKGPAIFIG